MGRRGAGGPGPDRRRGDRPRGGALPRPGRLSRPLPPALGVARFRGLVVFRRARPDQDLRPHPARGGPVRIGARGRRGRAQLLSPEPSLSERSGRPRGAREGPRVRHLGRGVRQPGRRGGPAGNRRGRGRHAAVSRDETARFCEDFGLPYLKAIAMREGVDLVAAVREYPSAAAWLLDVHDTEKWGGTGRTFDWSAVRGASNGRSCSPGGSPRRTSRTPSASYGRSRWTCAGEWNRPGASRTRRSSRPL